MLVLWLYRFLGGTGSHITNARVTLLLWTRAAGCLTALFMSPLLGRLCRDGCDNLLSAVTQGDAAMTGQKNARHNFGSLLWFKARNSLLISSHVMRRGPTANRYWLVYGQQTASDMLSPSLYGSAHLEVGNAVLRCIATAESL